MTTQPAMMTADGATTPPAVWRVIVRGRPRPKGDMTCIGKRGRVNHMMTWKLDAAAKKWRKHLTEACGDLAAQIPTAPIPQPVAVGILTVLERGKTVTRALPTVKGNGDVDKFSRMVLDALTDGGVISDDTLVAGLLTFKVYEAEGREPGAHIYVAANGPGRHRRVLDAIHVTAPELDQLN